MKIETQIELLAEIKQATAFLGFLILKNDEGGDLEARDFLNEFGDDVEDCLIAIIAKAEGEIAQEAYDAALVKLSK